MYQEQWFSIESAPVNTEDWNAASSRTFDSAASARRALRKMLLWPTDQWQTRIVRKTLTTEPWPARHIKPLYGQCKECGHYGSDCKSAKVA